MKIEVSSFDAGIVIILFIWYDECRRPKTGHPRGGSITIQKPPARRASERPWGGSPSYRAFFMVRV